MAELHVSCPKCQTRFRVDESHAGKRARCKRCGTPFVITASDAGAALVPETAPDSTPKATVSTPVSAAETGAAEENVPLIWDKGDVILDLYEVKDIHTGGGMGLVYRVHHRSWNMDLAVKSPRPEYLKTEHQKENFERECETWVNLGLHPHIVSCYYVRRLGGIPRVFAEYVEGGSLEDWIQSGKLYEGGHEESLRRILDIAIQFAWGLQYAHEQGLVHQDVKPLNLMMTPDGTAKVTDFGLARARAVTGEPTETVAQRSILVSGGQYTPAYCSPEQANHRKLSHKTDIWSWAVSILEMFTGEVTWPSGTVAAEALQGYLEVGAEEDSIPKMPEALAELLRHCFQQAPEARPQDVPEIVAGLQEMYQQATGRAYPRQVPRPLAALADSLNNRGVSLVDLGKQEEAKKLFEEALKVHAGHPEATYNRGLLLWRAANITDEALVTQLEEARKTHPDSWSATYILGLVHMERWDMESAVNLLGDAVKLGGSPEVEAVLAQARALLPEAPRCVRVFEPHPEWVSSAGLSADARWALSASWHDAIRVWEVSTGRCLHTLKAHDVTVRRMSAGVRERSVRRCEYQEGGVECVCLSADGRSALSTGTDRKVRTWDLETGACVGTHQLLNTPVRALCVTADGRQGLSASVNGELILWEISTGRCLQRFEAVHGPLLDICVAPDGRWVLTAGPYKALTLWDMSTGRCVRRYDGHSHRARSVCFSADGYWALSGSDDETLRLWEVGTGRCAAVLAGHTGPVTSVFLSADSRWAVSGSNDNRLRVWDVATGRCIRTLEGHTSAVACIAVSRDGCFLLTGSADKTVRLWDVAAIPQHAELLRPVPLGICRALSAEEAGEAEAEFHELLHHARSAANSTRYGKALKLIREARSLAAREMASEALDLLAELSLRCRRIGLRSGRLARVFEGHSEAVRSVCMSPDGRWALSGSSTGAGQGNEGELRLWGLATRGCVRAFGQGWRHSVCLSGDARWAVSDSGICVAFWNVATGTRLADISIYESKTHHRVLAVALSPDGRWALVGGTDRAVRLCDVVSKRCLRMLKEHTGHVVTLSFSSDGRYALSGSGGYGIVNRGWGVARGGVLDSSLRLWDVATGRSTGTFEGHTQAVNSVSLSADGRWALSGSDDMTLRLWDIEPRQCLRTFEGHAKAILSVCLSKDGRWVLSGSADKTLRLWNAVTGECRWTFEGHTDAVTSVCLSGDGRWVLSGSSDRTLRLWELEWELEAVEPADWDEGARPYLETFLTLHTPCAGTLPEGREPTEEEITLALTRRGKPSWTEDDFQQLLHTLGCAGYGWLRPEGVRKKLEEMAANWQGPPPLPGA